MAKRKKKRSRSRSSNGRYRSSSSGRRRSSSGSSGKRRRSRRPKAWAGLRYRKFNPDAGGFNPEVSPASPPSLRPRKVAVSVTIGRNPNARDARNAFQGCVTVAKSTKCSTGRNPRVVMAAALRSAAGSMTKRSGAFAALNLGAFGGHHRRRRKRR